MQERRAPEFAELPRGHPHLRSGGDRRGGYPLGVPVGVGRFGVDDPREGAGDAVQPRGVGGEHAVVRLHRREARPRVAGAEPGPEAGVGSGRLERPHQLRVEPPPGAATCHRQGGGEIAAGVEDLGRLRQAGDAREERDLAPPRAGGDAAPVPVLVEGAHGFAGFGGHLEHGRDLGAALAAGADQLGSHRSRRGEPRDLADALGGRPVRTGVPDDVQERGEAPRPVDGLPAPLDLPVVGGEDGAGGRGVRRAPRVLEQQRVEERRSLARAEGQLVRDAHPDQAGADRVALGLPLGEIERARQGRDHLGDEHRRRVGHAFPSAVWRRSPAAIIAYGIDWS